MRGRRGGERGEDEMAERERAGKRKREEKSEVKYMLRLDFKPDPL